jgi:hypothetical protein
MRVDSLSNALLGIVDSERWVASLAAGESRRCGAGKECESKAPPFSDGRKRMGDPGLLIAQPGYAPRYSGEKANSGTIAERNQWDLIAGKA